MKNANERTTTTTTPTTFETLLRNYENAPTTTDPLIALATAVTYSVLRKCIDVSGNRMLIETRKDLTKAQHDLATIANINATAYETRYNENGDVYTAVLDKDADKALERLCDETLGDGLDLRNDAIVAILDETEKAKERNGGTLPPCFMETPYSVRRLKRKVWIKAEDSANGWEDTTTTPVQEIYKAVRRCIEKSRAVQADPRNGYTYIEDYATDENGDGGEKIFVRFGKYADLGGYTTGHNGKTDFDGTYSASAQVVDDYTATLEKLNLTARQAKIVELRMRGYGYVAIATYLGISDSTVRTTLYKVRNKCEKIGFTPAMWAEMNDATVDAETTDPTADAEKAPNKYSMQTVYSSDIVGAICDAYGVSEYNKNW